MEHAVSRADGQHLVDPEALWNAFKYEVRNLNLLDATPDNIPAFRRTVAAYRAFRDIHVPRRQKRKTSGRSPSLDRWTTQRENFRTKCYGVDEGHYFLDARGKRQWKEVRRFKGVRLDVAQVIRCYQALWNVYWPHTPEGRESLRLARKRYAKSPHGRAKLKAAETRYRATERGQTALKTAKANAKRKRSVAKGLADQALYDSWVASEALDDV